MRIEQLVKTYRLLNDPEAPSWSIKFTGVLAAVALVAAGVGAVAYASRTETGAESAYAARGAGEQTTYVGLDPATLRLGEAPALDAEEAFAQWQREHPGAQVVSREPVHWTGHLVGYHVRYVER